MADFAPKLGGGVAFNQPVSQPNAMGAVADLFKSTLKTSGDGPKLTEDEKFAITLKKFEAENSIGGGRDLDRELVRKFIWQNPQFGPQMMTHAESLGVMVSTPMEASRDAAMDWAKTPEGIEAIALTSNMEPEEADAFISKSITEQKTAEAEVARLKRNTEKLALEGTLETEQWKAILPTQKSAVDNAIDVYFKPIFDEVVTKGGTIQISPEEQEALGINYSSVSIENLPAVLYDIKRQMEGRVRNNFMNIYGVDSIPSEDWSKQAFASIDNLITASQKFDEPGERAAFLEGLVKEKAYKALDDAGVAVSVEIYRMLPPEAAALLYPKLTNLTGKLATVISNGQSILSTDQIKTNVDAMSTSDADKLAEETIQVLDAGGMTAEFFSAFEAAQDRNGYNIVDGAAYSAIIGKNIDKIKTLTAKDPKFRESVGQWLISDIQETVSAVQSNLPAGLVVSANNGKFIVTAGEDFNWAGFDAMNEARLNGGQSAISIQQYIQDSLSGLPKANPNKSRAEAITGKPVKPRDGLSLDVLNQKVSTLSLLGEFGKEVQGSIGLLDTDTKATNSKPTRGGPKGRGRGRARNVGAELGIDFEGYEVEAGLPPGFLNTMALIESGGNPSAQNSESSAGGLFQQIDSNAAQYGVADRFDPVQSTEGAVAFAQDNIAFLSSRLGREPTGGELYLAHQQGPAGAARLLSNPDKLAVDIVGADAVRLNGGSLDMTAQEFANIWINKYNKIATGGIGPAGAPVSVTEPKTPTLPLDSASPDASVMQTGTASNTPVESLGGTVEALNSPEVQQIVEKAQTAPEEALTMAKEVLTRPIDPMVKALIEALVMIGEKKT